MFEGRLFRILAALAGLWFVFLCRVLLLQTTGAEEARREVEDRRTVSALLPPTRGTLRDADGKVLARDDLGFELLADPRGLGAATFECLSCARRFVTFESDPGPGPDEAPPAPAAPPAACTCASSAGFRRVESDAAERLAALLGEEPAALAARLDALRLRGWTVARARAREKGERWRKLTLQDWTTRRRSVAREVPREVALRVSLDPEGFRGFAVEARALRRLDPDMDPNTRVLLGTTGPADARDTARLLGEGLTRQEILAVSVGRSGVERAFDGALRGEFGRESAYRDLHGSVLSRETRDPVVDGEDLRLTVSDALNGAARGILGGSRGALVAMDPRTGAILAAAGNDGPEGGGVFPPAAGYLPGSVFKVLTAAVALEGDLAPGAGEVECRGARSRPLPCSHDHGRPGMREAISGSCNAYFGETALRIGVRPLEDWARLLRIDRPPGLRLPGEGGGTDWIQALYRDEWERTDLANLGIGQGPVNLSPLQVAALYAAVANGGRPVTPHLVAGRGPAPGEPVFSPATLWTVRAGLEDTVLRGTGSGKGLEEFRFAGKTGTAQVKKGPPGERRLHAWFAGYAPAEDPRIVVVAVLLDQQESGGDAAGPLVAEFLRAWRRAGEGR